MFDFFVLFNRLYKSLYYRVSLKFKTIFFGNYVFRIINVSTNMQNCIDRLINTILAFIEV